jgi:beta-glucosidase
MLDHASEDLLARARALRLPRDFVFGGATAAYQIEGGWNADGKGESIWDRFCRKPGAIIDGTSGGVACDHYHLWPDDIRLMQVLGLDAYRFSIAWSRVQPDWQGALNPKGIAFYDRLIDGLLQAGITPYLTLYHWDLPQALQDKGGWYNRDTAHRLADHAETMARAFGDRVKHWTTLNEPWTFCWSGHASGEDAPGLADGVKGGLAASHHALLGHGLSVPRIRAAAPGAEVGIVLDLNVVEPASARPQDVQAARHFELAQNRFYLDAVFKGRYPQELLALCDGLLPEIRDGDLDTIAAPLDYLGVNIYRRSVMQAGTELPPLNFARVNPPGDYTAVGYEIHPPCIHDILVYVHQDYAPKAIHISESGMATRPEAPEPDGLIHDRQRAAYYVDHIAELDRARRKGVPVKAYFAWTLIDNFEWAFGYTTPFGIVHVDLKTQKRTPKLSALCYQEVLRART